MIAKGDSFPNNQSVLSKTNPARVAEKMWALGPAVTEADLFPPIPGRHEL